ncbi:MAG: septum formation initiator family protein [bacterium]
MNFKTFLQITIIIGFCTTFGYHVIWNEHGLLNFYELKREVTKQQTIVTQLQQDIKHLQTQIQTFQADDFEKEKIAREDLQMGCTNELVYILPKSNS